MNSVTEYSAKSIFATLPRTTRGMPLVLGGDPKGKTFLYCNGNSVIIRDIDNPAISEIYTEHSVQTTVAKYAPTGFYIASGDQSGKIRIWDTTQKTHLLKAEYQPINGAIRDIAWSADGQRIAVVGEGRERFGHVFLFDTGTSNGNMSGQSKAVNTVDFRPTRPYRIISASEDNTVAIYEGPPFKFKTYFQKHTRFAHCARYSPDGNLFASCSADGKIFLYEGGEGTDKGELVDSSCNGNAHGGGVYSLQWNPDGTRLLSVSGDRTCKIWDVSSQSLMTTFNMGTQVEDQQLGCLWQGQYLLSTSLSGFIYYLDPNNPTKPIRIVQGHNRPITALAVNEDRSKIYTADMDGGVTSWDSKTGENERIQQKIHKSQVQRMQMNNQTLTTVGMDDVIAFTNLNDAKNSNQQKLSSQPRGVAVSQDGAFTVVACEKEVRVYRGIHPFTSLKVPYEASCVSMHPVNRTIAVGGNDSKVHIYQLSGEALTVVKELPHNGQITCVEYSPDGNFLAACDAARRVVPYRLPDYEVASAKEWTFHTARVNCLSWCPDNRHLVSGSLDTNLIVWDLEKSGDHPIIIKGAHAMSQITAVAWLDLHTVVSTGQDSNMKQWTIHY